MTLTGLISVVMVNLLGQSPETAAMITKAITVIVGMFVGAQGLADGISKGATSSNASDLLKN